MKPGRLIISAALLSLPITAGTAWASPSAPLKALGALAGNGDIHTVQRGGGGGRGGGGMRGGGGGGGRGGAMMGGGGGGRMGGGGPAIRGGGGGGPAMRGPGGPGAGMRAGPGPRGGMGPRGGEARAFRGDGPRVGGWEGRRGGDGPRVGGWDGRRGGVGPRVGGWEGRGDRYAGRRGWDGRGWDRRYRRYWPGGVVIGAPWWYGDDYWYGYDYGDYGGTVVVSDDAEARCQARYRSYDPATGTFLGYDGIRRRCPYLP